MCHAVVWRVQFPGDSKTIINLGLNTRDGTWQERHDWCKQGSIEVSAMLFPNTCVTLAKDKSVVVFIPWFNISLAIVLLLFHKTFVNVLSVRVGRDVYPYGLSNVTG